MRRILKMMGEILILSVLVAIMAVGVSAKENNISWTFHDDTKTLTIRGDGVVEYNRKWKKLKPKHIKIEEGIDEIGYYAFSDMKTVKSISIPKSVKEIGGFAFENSGIKKITIGKTVKKIHRGIFYNCQKLETVNWHYKEIPSYTFEECESLKKINMYTKIKTIGKEAFESTGFEEFKMPDSVQKVGPRAFAYCAELKKIVFSKNMQVIPSGIIEGCDRLEKVILKEGVRIIGKEAFADSKIPSIKIPNTVKVIKTGAFEGTEGIRKIVIPPEVKRIHDDTFKECKDLETIVFNKKVRSIGENAFAKCGKLKSVAVPGNVKSIEYKAFEKSGCKEVIISKGVKEIDYRAFNNCDQLEKVSISDTVSVISDNSFANCDKLTQIVVNPENEVYASVDNCLLNKNKTELLQVPGGKKGVYEIPATVTKVYPQAFYGCKSITAIASTNNPNFKSVDGILYDRTGTKLISSPINKTGTIVIPSNVLIIGESAFQNSKASQIIIPSSVVSMEQCAFEYCNNLTYMKIPGNVEKVSQAAFWECNKLTKVIIESGTKKIQRNAFHGCGKLRKIVVPISVYFINETAFSECWRVSLYCKKSSCAMSFANKHDYRYKVI